MRKPEEIVLRKDLKFKFLPDFARFILANKLREFAREQWRLVREADVPSLDSHTDISPSEEAIEKIIFSNRNFLLAAADNKLSEQLREAVEIWVNDQLTAITHDQVVVDDITLASYIRKQTFMLFLSAYTTDIAMAMQLIHELDQLILETESVLLHAFSRIQQEKINQINLELKEREEQLLEAQNISRIGSFEWKLDGGESRYTPQVHEIFEIDPLKKQSLETFFDHVFPADRARVKDAIDKAITGGGNYECEYRYKKHGGEKVLWSRGMVIFDGEKPVSIKGIVMDITDRHQMLQQLRINEELYKQAQKLTHIGNWAWDMHNGKITLSDELYSIYGLREAVEISPAYFFSFVHPDDQVHVEQQWNEALNKTSANPIDFKIIRPDGSIRIIHQNIEVLKDEHGNPYKIIGTGQDLTQEYLLDKEISQKNKELERSNKELTSFSYVVSHDLQEPLRKIKTFSDLILEKDMVNLSAEGKEHFNRIISAAQRMQRLIDDLLSFSRTQTNTNPRESTDLNQLLEEALKEKKIDTEVGKLPQVNAIPFQMRQLFDNIIGNAIKYSHKDRELKLKISAELVKGRELFPESVHEQGNYHVIRFEDNGIGFDQKHAEKIFEVFQRLHGRHEYSGTGIGLSICKKIAENHSGFILAKGKVNEGAVFELYLPVEH